MNGKVWKIGRLYVLVSSLIITGVANAACMPTSDCASIGYTETSCKGDFVRCPFDISKLLCLPCDSSYQYTCSGDMYGDGKAGSKSVTCFLDIR